VLAVPGSTALFLAAFSFKVAFTNEDSPELVEGIVRYWLHLPWQYSLLSRARIVFIGLAVSAAAILCAMTMSRQASVKASGGAESDLLDKDICADIWTGIKTLHHLYTLLALTQSRVTKIPLFLFFHILFKFLCSRDLSLAELSTTSLLLQFASFFAFGGSNAISSIDLSSAYNGVGDFNVLAVGILTFVSNWAGPIYWTSATNILLLRKREAGEADVFIRHIAILTGFAMSSALAVMAACTVLRTHLFIWTVFSPKYLYCMAWSLGQHLLVNIGAGGALFWLGH
jgi:ethanolaminephosphotransferase